MSGSMACNRQTGQTPSFVRCGRAVSMPCMSPSPIMRISALATGCYGSDDAGLIRIGREVVAKMNRIGIVVDMSHSAERSTLDAIAQSSRPIAIPHANPFDWHPARRNKSETVLRALAESGGAQRATGGGSGAGSPELLGIANHGSGDRRIARQGRRRGPR
jgi:hypothetical protein